MSDFDGDVINVLYIINNDFLERAEAVFNPRNAMYISRNDGKFNNAVNFQRDTIINANTFFSPSLILFKKLFSFEINSIVVSELYDLVIFDFKFNLILGS